MGNVGAELRSAPALFRGRRPAVAELMDTAAQGLRDETGSRDLPWPAASGTRT